MTEYVFDLSAFESEELDDGMREEIVRCRDCRHYDNRHGECSALECRECWTKFKPEPDGFCAWGERKES